LTLAAARDEHVQAESALEKLQADLLELFQGRDVAGAAELKEQLAELRGELHEITRQVSALVNDSLGLTPSIDLLNMVVAEADNTLHERRQLEVSGAVVAELAALVRKITSVPVEPKLTTGQRKQLRALAEQEAASLGERTQSTLSALDGFSDSELQRMRAKAASLGSGQALLELRGIVKRRQDLRLELRRIEADLRTFEQSGVAADLLNRRPTAEARLAHAAENLEQADGVAAEAERRLKLAHARINELEESLAAIQSSAAKASIARHARLGLEHFVREMRSRRTTSLEAQVSVSIRELLHREGALSEVAIDADSGAVTLFDGRHHEIAVPSAGEKELFALSLIKALGKLSNRDAPMVIDTPLGRLDKAHRAAIVGRFLPNAASQVIVLATDSEIHGELYAAIRPHLAWQATLSPVRGGGVRVSEGRYFEEEALR
jgi:DNA sulfur modification protein DndD